MDNVVDAFKVSIKVYIDAVWFRSLFKLRPKEMDMKRVKFRKVVDPFGRLYM